MQHILIGQKLRYLVWISHGDNCPPYLLPIHHASSGDDWPQARESPIDQGIPMREVPGLAPACGLQEVSKGRENSDWTLTLSPCEILTKSDRQ